MRYARAYPLLLIFSCLQPAAALAADFYVDPEAGAPEGDGSLERPWRTLEEVVAAGLIETRALAEHPYVEGGALVGVNVGAPVQPGDTIWLEEGHHGALTLDGADNADLITIRARPEARPTLSKITLRGAARWRLEGLHIRPDALEPTRESLVEILSHSWHGPSEEVELLDATISTLEDASAWGAAEWDALARSAVYVTGDDVTVRGCHIYNVNFGIQVTGARGVIMENTIDGFSGDGLRGLGDDGLFEANLVTGCVNVNDNHDDGFQSWSLGEDGAVGQGAVRGITLRGNTIINLGDPDDPLSGPLQGIGCFDGFFEGWRVENNVIVTNHFHGLTLLGARDSVIINNTVIAPEGERSWIMIAPHKDGRPSEGVIVRNNLTRELSLEGAGIVEDHNQLVDDPSAWFIDLAALDLRLRPDAPALDVGSAEGAPGVDIEGTPRPQGAGIDIGAYERPVEAPVEPDAGVIEPDATTPARDGYVVEVDMGSIEPDSGADGPDTGAIEPDAEPPEADSAPPTPDGAASSGGSSSDGCQIGGSAPSAPLLLAVMLLALRRRTCLRCQIR